MDVSRCPTAIQQAILCDLDSRCRPLLGIQSTWRKVTHRNGYEKSVGYGDKYSILTADQPATIISLRVFNAVK